MNFAGSTATGTQTVNGAATTTCCEQSESIDRRRRDHSHCGWSSAVAGTTVPTGTVVFQDGSTILGSGTLGSDRHATYAPAPSPSGPTRFRRPMAGDSFFSGSVSPAFPKWSTAPLSRRLLPGRRLPPIAYGTPLSATQLNATATNSAGDAIPGTYVYTPPSGTVLNPGITDAKRDLHADRHRYLYDGATATFR